MFVTRLLVVFLLVGIAVALGQSNNDFYEISGRVVDELGNPRANAGICLEPTVYKSKSFDRLINCVGASDDGTFFILKPRTKETKGETFSLFVYVNNTKETLTRVTPPFDGLRSLDRTFEGAPVKLGRRSVVELGDVKAQFFYGSVKLELAWADENPVDWTGTFLVVRTQKGHLAEAMTLGREDVRTLVKNKGKQLDVALPSGMWKIELVNMDTDIKFAESNLFQVFDGANNEAVQLHRVTPTKVSFP